MTYQCETAVKRHTGFECSRKINQNWNRYKERLLWHSCPVREGNYSKDKVDSVSDMSIY